MRIPPALYATTLFLLMGSLSSCRMGFESLTDRDANGTSAPDDVSSELTAASGGSGLGPGGGQGQSSGGVWTVTGGSAENGSGGATDPDDIVASGGADQDGGSLGSLDSLLDWVVLVSTGADEDDPNATPDEPGQSGLSLREAITYANQSSLPKAIAFARSDFEIRLGTALPILVGPVTLTGPVNIDGSDINEDEACLKIDGRQAVIHALEVSNCPAQPVLIDPGASDAIVSGCVLRDNGGGLVLDGESPVAVSNRVERSGAQGIEVTSPSAQVLNNHVLRSLRTNILIHPGASQALIVGNLSVGGEDGIALGETEGVRVWHNTIVGSGASGLDLGAALAVDVRNNIFAGASASGIRGSAAQLSELDYNLFFENEQGHCSACALGDHTVLASPSFVEASDDNFALGSASPAIDAGVDLGQDRNVSRPGLFDGTAPDLGCVEFM